MLCLFFIERKSYDTLKQMKALIKRFLPQFLISWYHFGTAFFGALWYGFPSQRMVIIGVTGTNGKSTTVDMISRVFRQAGFKTASLSSIRFQILDKEWKNKMKMTMPGRFVIQQFLRQAKDAGCTHAVVEVTSEGILQHRHRFINFHTAIFTNLSPEHIERHGSFEKYREAKGELFKMAKQVHVINGDDENAKYFIKFFAKEKWIYGTKNSNDKISWPGGQISNQVQNTKYQILNTEFIETLEKGVKFRARNTDFFLNLLGVFNAYNALAAICVAVSQGISLEVCKQALEKMEGVPGRMEEVIKQPFRVIVDYAFTPAALEKVYKTLKEIQNTKYKTQDTKLICVLGAAGGGRDKWKRPVLGKIAATYCDKIIITNEDPYDEDPSQILSQIKSGISNSKFQMSNFHEILDRKEAIAKALSFASTGDTVIITGKGSEDSIAVAGGKKIPWDDREVVREEFYSFGK